VQLQEQGQLRAVDLWPGVDQYDLRIVFNTGEVWAIDIKDIANPGHLRSQLQQEPQFVNVGDLSWDKAWFVVPQYRCEWSRDYVRRATPEGFWAKVQGMRTFQKALKSTLK
ncbi:MAG: hypothetical protein RBT75_20620, partial [Anaerolineae bacterium]|nr:hypothetical protein [Anaerolineae bacterium]